MRLVLEDEQKLRNFAASLVPPVKLKESTPSTQGDYSMKGGVNQARQVVDYLNGDRARQVFSTGLPWQVLQHMGLDGASSNMSERVGLARCIRGYIAGVAPGAPPPFLVQHRYPHQLDLLVHATWDAVPYLCKVMDPMPYRNLFVHAYRLPLCARQASRSLQKRWM